MVDMIPLLISSGSDVGCKGEVVVIGLSTSDDGRRNSYEVNAGERKENAVYRLTVMV